MLQANCTTHLETASEFAAIHRIAFFHKRMIGKWGDVAAGIILEIVSNGGVAGDLIVFGHGVGLIVTAQVSVAGGDVVVLVGLSDDIIVVWAIKNYS